MVRSLMVVALAGSLLAGCAREMTRAERSVEQQILEGQLTDWSRAFNNRDVDSLASFYHQVPELTVAWPDGRRTRGWLEESAAQTEFFRGIVSMNLVLTDPATEVINAGAAVSTFRFSADVILATTQRDIFSGSGTIVWMKDAESGRWVIHALQKSRTPPPPPPPAPARRR